MMLMVGCGVLVAVGLVLIVLWGSETVQPPPEEMPGEDAPHAAASNDGPRPAGVVIRRYLWWVALVLGCGASAGLLMAGAGGRLAMRLLAVTAGDEAQGRVTEADQVVGQITGDGTTGFIIFIGLFFGVLIGLFYLIIHRWLPRGRLGGFTFGVLLLLWFAVPFDPLRPENPDFEIVGPGWVSIVTFSALVILHGMLVAAIAGRYSRSLPIVSKRVRTMVPYAPLLLLVPGFVLGIVVIVGMGVALAVDLVPAVPKAWASSRMEFAARAIAVVVTAVMLPRFVSAVMEILEKSP
jgi:hypothetical protein